jgi:hypothetical protein
MGTLDATPSGPELNQPPAGASPPASLWLRELPYIVVLVLTLFGVAYAAFSKRPVVGYWEFLTPLIGVLCIGSGWNRVQDKTSRLRLIWTQVLHWLAFLVAMNLTLLSGVQSTVSTETGLVILALLALGTFVAGVHILAWQICVLGVVMALCVPAIAWIERSALFLALAALALVGIGAAFWWRRGWNI